MSDSVTETSRVVTRIPSKSTVPTSGHTLKRSFATSGLPRVASSGDAFGTSSGWTSSSWRLCRVARPSRRLMASSVASLPYRSSIRSLGALPFRNPRR